jgi:hypothetical protein
MIKDRRTKLHSTNTTISDLSFDLSKEFEAAIPRAKAAVWQAAKIYPADEPSSMGKTICKPYRTKTG